MPACFPASWGPMVPEEASLPIDVGVPRRPVTIRSSDRNRVVGLLRAKGLRLARLVWWWLPDHDKGGCWI